MRARYGYFCMYVIHPCARIFLFAKLERGFFCLFRGFLWQKSTAFRIKISSKWVTHIHSVYPILQINSFYARLLCRCSGKTPLDNSKNTILGHKRNYSFTAIVKVSYLIKPSLISERIVMLSIFASDVINKSLTRMCLFANLWNFTHTHVKINFLKYEMWINGSNFSYRFRLRV